VKLKKFWLDRFTLCSIFAAALLWGGWAYLVNHQSQQFEVALRTAVLQGIYSAVMTLYISSAVYFLWQKVSGSKGAWFWPTLLTAGHTGALLTLVHWWNGTPHILKTVSAPIAVTVIYCFLLTFKLQKSK
jgi:hypothetical protein